MGISNALNNAVSGLSAASRNAQTVSSNIANALTPGYGRREVSLASRVLAGGVAVAGVARVSNPALLGERRSADAAVAQNDTTATALQKLVRGMGEVGTAQSLPSRVSGLVALLIETAAQPASQPRLNALSAAARDLADTLNDATDRVQAMRREADTSIGNQVDRLNESLARIDKLNEDIRRAGVQNADINGYIDARQSEIDNISGIVPIRELARPNNGVALITVGGTVLLDDRPAEIGFSRTNAMSPAMTLNAPLSTLTVNGRDIDMNQATGRMSGGSLQAAFDLRDTVGVAAQTNLDGVARDLIERLAAPGVDATLAPGDPGLFTDAGASFATANELGLAGRIQVNLLVDPQQGGAVWRLRDGLGAAAPGPQGDASLLNALQDALTRAQPAASAALGTASLSMGGQADAVLSDFGTALFRAEKDRTFALSRSAELIGQELELGVDTDAELQTLLLVEQIYSANTKVILAADAMIQQLLEI